MNEHKCPQNQLANTIKVIYGPSIDYGPAIENNWKSWILQVLRIAGVQDVRDGEAETIGEVLYQSEFIISYCPFCGAELTGATKNFMVIDGAQNSTHDVFSTDEATFAVVFPNNSDVAFLDDAVERVKELGLDEVSFFNQLYSNRLEKKSINGLHGILHSMGSYCHKEYFLTRKESDVSK